MRKKKKKPCQTWRQDCIQECVDRVLFRRSLWDSLTGWVVSRTPQEWMTAKNKGLEGCRNEILGRDEDSRSGMYT